MRKRLRPAYSEDELKRIYSEPHNHYRFTDHRLRVQMTIAFASWFRPVESVADLSCGDAVIANNIEAKNYYLGDYAPGYEFQGAIDDTIDLIPSVDLYICSETIEHLDNPETTLRKIRAKTKYLILTTPNGEDNDANPEHYWGWDMDGVRELLINTGFKPVISNLLKFESSGYVYDYQFWGCE